MKPPVVILLCLSLAGCTVAPDLLSPASQPSFDGGVQNSGFVQFTADGGALITPHARDRYNALVAKYGRSYSPPLVADEGLAPSNGLYHIDAQHLAYFAEMNLKNRSNLEP